MLDKNKYLKRVIIGAWISLLLCFTIKIFGGNFFDIICNNANFIAICNYADTHFWAYYLISGFYCIISLYFFCLAIMGKIKYKSWQLLLVIITVVIGTFIKIKSSNLGIVFDFWQFIFLPFLLLENRFRNCWKIFLANGFLLLFQFISMITKNIEITIITNKGVLISAIFGIDVIIMVILYYAYANTMKRR